MSPARETLEADVLIVGAGPAGLACALHLANLFEQHTAAKKSPALSAENIYVLEKAREIGAHQLSGAIMDPRALRELVPDFEKSAPLDTPVTGDAAYYLTETGSFKLPITPPPLRNHGNYVISLNKLVKWLGGLVEKKGVNLFTQFAGRELLYEKNGIAGVLTEDKGVDKNGKPKDNFTPGYELRAKVTVLAEGPRGSLTKDLVNQAQTRRPESAGLRHRHQGTLGRAARAHRHRLRGAHARLAAQLRPIRRRLDLRHAGRSRLARHGRRPRISQSAFRSARGVSEIQNASVREDEFSKAASWFATARKRFPMAAGIPCRKVMSMAD